jgi:putative membrane protein
MNVRERRPSHEVVPDDGGMLRDDRSTELSSARTARAYDRTSMAADRTLMAVIRTSLSLITFGFTIYQFFDSVAAELRPGLQPGHAPRNFGMTLILLGIGMLLLGIVNHHFLLSKIHERRARLIQLGLLRHNDVQRTTMVSIIAILLLVIGIAAVASVAFRSGPFS